ncbi:MFS transporter [Sphingomonas histidinilytica]|uniref:Major Facilitator Superfamily protein n=1 Tax=Rhizorhabdus histidinilytica TaxID=439228 RepID=A0A1T5ENN6_9SPHN|nr:MFS transporter [Rhizorhabdus histidinilytica]MBO9376704.1 MFS transporter [Rhizorhabdus histidinilytica]SKB85582.1 Major Facilitator Superfamily protein [Rhizorhabdus histidinilytica]
MADRTAPPASLVCFDRRFLLPLLVAATLNPMNSAMLATALVPIGRAFPQQEAIAAWLIATLYLTAAVAQPVLGGIADKLGARRTLLGGMGFLAAGAVLGAIAFDPWTLIASRALIGFGTAVGFPCAVVMIRQRSEHLGIEPPARLLGLLSMASSASMAVGPPLGGVLTGLLGWRWVFLINLPLAIVTAALAIWLSPADDRLRRESRARFDLPGIALFTLAMTALMLFLMNLAKGVHVGGLVAATLLAASLVIVEGRMREPFIDFRLIIANRALAGTYAHHVLLNFLLYCLFYSIPQWAQAWLHVPIEQSGLVLLPVAVSSSLASLAPTRGAWGRAMEIAGLLSLIVTSGGLFLLDGSTTLAGLIALTLLFGIGNGALNMVNQQRMLDHAPPDRSGTAAGLLRTAQYCGAILSAPFTAYLLGGHFGPEPMKALGLALLPIAALMLLLTLRRLRSA